MYAAWHGLTLLHDHPFWQTHFAPNGWGCRCRITPVSRKEGEASARAGLGQPPQGWDTIDPKTGAMLGIDKGFDYAPGATWHPQLDKYSFGLAQQIVAANLQDGVLDRWLEQVSVRIADEQAKPEYKNLPLAQVSVVIRRALATKERIAVAVMDVKGLQALKVQPSDKTLSGHTTQTIWLSDDTAIKQALHHGASELPLGSYTRLQAALEAAQYVEIKDGTKLIYFHQGGDWAVAVIKATRTKDELYLVSMHKTSQREVDAAVRSGKAIEWTAS